MSESTRPKVRAVFRIGPWVPGFVLPAALGLIGIAATVLVLQDVLVAVGVVLSLVSALRVRSAAPWLLVAVLVIGQVLRDPAALDAELPALVLALHLLAVLTLLARVVPLRSRVQLAALLLASAGRLQVLPTASSIGGALLVLVAGLLVVPRRAEPEE